MTSPARLILCASVLALSPSATFAAQAPAAATQASAHDRLFQLFKESDEASLKRNPIQALFRGDMRYADHLGDLFSDAHYQAEKAADEHDLAALHAVPRNQLNADRPDRVRRLRISDPGCAPRVRARHSRDHRSTADEPLLRSAHRISDSWPEGKARRRSRRSPTTRTNLKRNRDFATNIDEAIAQWKKGEAEGIVDTKLTVRNMIEQLDNQLKMKPEDSPYWGPIKSFPASISMADRARLTNEYRESLNGTVYPALQRMRDFLANEYLAHARDGFGLMYMKGGDKYYRYLIEQTTTEDARSGAGARARPQRSRSDHQGLRADPAGGRLQGHAKGIFRLHAHQPQVPAEEQGRAGAGLRER